MGKIIVLGATGTLGLPICRHLKEQGYDVLAIGHSSRGKDLFEKLGIDFNHIEISDINTFNVLPQENVECVINFAGCLPAMMKERDSNALYSDTIIKGTINVLDYMRKVGCKKLIFPQSVYDTHYLFGSPEPISADAERKTVYEGDHSIYVTCKNAAIDIIHYYENTYGIQSIILRLPGVFQYHPKPYILINGKKRIKLERVWIEKAKRGETLEIWGDCKRVLESVCIEDFLQIVQKAVESKSASGIYNVGNGGASLEERVLAIRDVFGKEGHKSNVVYYPEKTDCTQYVLDIEKTKKVLGYSPNYTWTDYLKQLKWHMENQPNKEIWGNFEDYYSLLTISSDEDRFEK
ncbi:MAG: NAD(P)-dependent oxidoreductase [Lachnospiraceae bacterium]|nr:NAD(P)-dependent oxidoreductase [Lachnospiraceae bacterium]